MTKFVQVSDTLMHIDSIQHIEQVSRTPPRVRIQHGDASGFSEEGTLEEWEAKLSDPSDHIVTTVFIPEGSIGTGQWSRTRRIFNRRAIDEVQVSGPRNRTCSSTSASASSG